MGTCKMCGRQTMGDYEYCYDHKHLAFKGQPPRPATFSTKPQSGGGLPADYLKDGYFENKNLREELIVEHARKIAEELDRAGMKAAALRKFFGKVKTIQRNLENLIQQNWQELNKINESKSDSEIKNIIEAAIKTAFVAVIPEILALVPYVNNAVTRGVVPVMFRNFIEKNVELAKKSQDAFSNGFVKHFEYIVAFFPRIER